MHGIAATIDFVSALFIVVIIFGMHITIKESTKKTRYFSYCLYICLFALIVDAVAYLLESQPVNNVVLWIFNYFAFVSIDCILVCYFLYLDSMVSEKECIFKKWFKYAMICLCGIDFIMLTIGSITGWLFKVRDGVLILGPLSDFIAVIPLIWIISILIVMFIRIKKIGCFVVLTLASYLFISFIAVALQFIFPALSFGYVSAAISLVVIYVLLQSRIIAETNIRADVYNYLSTRDDLTGLINRRGYEETITKLKDKERINIVFCDLNNLKYVNDNEGHAAGDNLIKKFAEMASIAFPSEHVCRISGDEFVVISEEYQLSTFLNQVEDFKRSVDSTNRIASIGYASGSGHKILSVVKDAENMMREDKDDYYLKTGKQRRV